MGLETALDARHWAPMPFPFWSAVFFVVGGVVGSFLNVVIHRLPRGESIVSPPSHCPHCQYAIPWYLNVPLVTWILLQGKCRHCGARISPRYLLVEFLTAAVFLGCWLAFGRLAPAVAAVYCVFLAGLIAASFIDCEHFIIPDELTLGGLGAGVLLSLGLPALQGAADSAQALTRSLVGAGVGAGLIYGILRLGKLLFGRHRVELAPDAKIVFTETALVLPDKEISYGELFYRKSDVVTVQARTVEMIDRCYRDVRLRLAPDLLEIGDDQFQPEDVPHLEAVAAEILLPREAMGLGDVKFMAAIGAFLGWKATVFSLFASSVIGAVIAGVPYLLRRGHGSRQIPYGPYIALAAAVWIFWGDQVMAWVLGSR